MEYLAGLIIDNERLLMSSFGGMVLYILLSKEPIVQRFLSGSAGFIAAVMFSEPAANLLTDGQGKEYYAAVIALCGQFIPELLKETVTKIKGSIIFERILKIWGIKKDD